MTTTRIIGTFATIAVLGGAMGIAAAAAGATARADDGAIFTSGAGSMKLSVLAGLDLATNSFTSAEEAQLLTFGLSQSTGTGFVGGVRFGYYLADDLVVELGVDYAQVQNRFSASASGQTNSEYLNFDYLQIPLVVRYDLLEFLTAGGGVYYGRGIGNVSIEFTGQGAPAPTSESFAQDSTKQNDAGLVFDVGGHLPLTSSLAAIVDIRYLLGLTNMNTSGDSSFATYLRDLRATVGLTLAL